MHLLCTWSAVRDSHEFRIRPLLLPVLHVYFKLAFDWYQCSKTYSFIALCYDSWYRRQWLGEYPTSNWTMHKIGNNFSRITPALGLSRFHTDIPQPQQPLRRPPATANIVNSGHSEYTIVNLSFNVPFASSLSGPDPDEILHASPGAVQRWTFAAGTPEGTPIYKLPVHVQNEERLRGMCQFMSDSSGGRIEAQVVSSELKNSSTAHQRAPGLITNVCISGVHDVVHKMRAKVLNETPIMMVYATDPSYFSNHLLT